MKVSAALLAAHALPRESTSAQKIASRAEPGQRIELADGSRIRVLQKSASPQGLRFVVAGDGGTQALSLRQLAALGPMSPGMLRLASFVRHVLAFDASVDAYVKEAIRAAGLPVDPTMNWSKYLDRMYTPITRKLTQDEDLRDEAVLDMVVKELIFNQMLSPSDTAKSHFNPDHASLQGKELANKVTAFLTSLFEHRKEDVVSYVKKQMGNGMRGQKGEEFTPSLDEPLDDSGDSGVLTRGDRLVADNDDNFDLRDSEEEVHEFLQSFQGYIERKGSKEYKPVLLHMTQRFEAGEDRKEISQQMVGNPDFQGKGGKTLDRDAYNYQLRQWARLIQDFATDPAEGWSNNPIAKRIALEAEMIAKAEGVKKEKKKTVAAGLHLADVEQNGQPVAVPGTVPPPTPPPNPNVQQQNALKPQPVPSAGALNTAQPAPAAPVDATGQPVDANGQPLQPPAKKTISPEIPGVNHTASQETPMPVKTKVAAKTALPSQKPIARTAAPKFARLRRIAEQKPEDVAEALGQLQETFERVSANAEGLSEQLDNFEDQLDLKEELPKEASIRQKVAHRNKFARTLKRLAAENPEELQAAVNDFYQGLNDLLADMDEAVEDVETLADNLGITLDMPEDGPAGVEDGAPVGEEGASPMTGIPSYEEDKEPVEA